ncbi:MAG: non-ribosomal peptide synthetase [Chloroflexota bacterium]|nr:non-ribosomal peptide synthetase [Chloroflexota bacterium]
MTSYVEILDAAQQGQHAKTAPPPATQWQQLAQWNHTRQSYPQAMCVQQLVETQAATRPESVALVEGERSLPYHELNQRANQLARHLQTLGVGPNVPVGVCIERSPELVVGLLAVLKAGGAYVPLDPAYPAERLAFMLSDAQISVLVRSKYLYEQLSMQGRHVVNLDTDQALLAQQETADLPVSATLDDLAYIIYTSGSTGHPKGVEITHASLLNLVCWHQKAFAVTATDRATQVTSPAFDATGWELWPYLTAGARVYLPDEETRLSPMGLRDWLLRCRITISFLPTALAESVLHLDWPSIAPLRFLLTGADALHHYPPAGLPFALVNNYGPTEATVVTTSGIVAPTAHATRPPSIGRPIANMQVYILDEQRQQVPVSASGELYIGGAGLARGYHNRPDLTAERFIPHPFSSDPGARLYKSGDMVRLLPDGHLDFIGRIDQQIKIRGYRIEPNEIVSVLSEHDGVQASYVMAREDTPDDKRLVAYVVLAPETPPTATELREALLARVPDYMVPSAFVMVDALPLTPNGKVDRAALPEPETTNTMRDGAIIHPSTPTEERIAAIVRELLNMDEISVDDNFFMLGGHSLLGTQIIARVAGTFGVDLSLRSLFEAPTIQQLAAEIEQLVLTRIEAMSDEEVLHMLQQG